MSGSQLAFAQDDFPTPSAIVVRFVYFIKLMELEMICQQINAFLKQQFPLHPIRRDKENNYWTSLPLVICVCFVLYIKLEREF